MKKLFKILSSRLFFSAILIAIQFAVIIVLFSRFVNNTFVSQFFTVLSFLFSLWVIFNKHEPEYAIGWLLIIMIFPLYGVLLYIIFGKKTLTFFSRKKLNKFIKAFAKTTSINEDRVQNLIDLEKYDDDLARQSKYISRSAYSTPWKNTEAKYYPLGDDFLFDFLEELNKAQNFIFIEFFIISFGEMWSKVLEVLEKKKNEGVEIRILYDDFGCIGGLPSNYAKQLRKDGFNASAFNPVKPHINSRLNYRDHRKICVIDGNVAFTGGVNLADEYINRDIRFGHWKDNAVRIKGLAVWDLTVLFLSMWNVTAGDEEDLTKYRPTYKAKDDGFVQPFGDNPLDDVAMAETAYLQIINMAKNYVWITTPYLVITRTMIDALSTAAQSGVDVRLIVPKIPDKIYVNEVSKSYYVELISAGIKIYEYTPGFIHSKMFICDDKVSIIGTVNMDYRSFYLHFECGVAFFGASVIKDVKKDMENILEVSDPIDYNRATSINLIRRIYRIILRLFAPIL
ncbi:MAG: cardiolipin synthase [Pleomorphochaeta sp.]